MPSDVQRMFAASYKGMARRTAEYYSSVSPLTSQALASYLPVCIAVTLSTISIDLFVPVRSVVLVSAFNGNVSSKIKYVFEKCKIRVRRIKNDYVTSNCLSDETSPVLQIHVAEN